MKSTPWTLDKTINLPFLITVAVLFASSIAFATRTDNRLAVLEQQTSQIAEMRAKLERMDERSAMLQSDVNRLVSYQMAASK